MMKIFKISPVIFAMALVLFGSSACRSDDSPQDLRTFRGQVMEIDWVSSLLTCQGEDEVTFYVPAEMRIRYGTDTVSLDDLEQEDCVVIKYIDDPTGTPKAVSVSVSKTYPEL